MYGPEQPKKPYILESEMTDFNINGFIDRLFEFIKDNPEEEVKGVFNGNIEFKIPSNSKPTKDQLFVIYEEESKKYNNSPEVKKRKLRQAQELKAEKIKMQKQVDIFLKEIENMDFSNKETVLDWIEKFQNPSGHLDISLSKSTIIDIFEGQGFNSNPNDDETISIGEISSNMEQKEFDAFKEIGLEFNLDNMGENEKKEHAEKMAEKIINLSLYFLGKGCIPPHINKYINKWKEIFGTDTMENKNTLDNIKKDL